jgi:hypothetical protein
VSDQVTAAMCIQGFIALLQFVAINLKALKLRH